MPEAVEKRVRADALCFPGREGRNRSVGARGLEQCDQVLIASISGPTPKIVIIRLRL